MAILADVELHCPVCGERLEEKPDLLGDFACGFCFKVSTRRSCVAARSRAERAAQPLGAPPEGVALTEDDFSFRCDVTKSDGVGPAVLWLTTLAFFVGGLIFFQRHDLKSEDFRVCFGIFAFLILVMGSLAVFTTFGTDSVLGTADTLEFRNGLRRYAFTRVIRRADIRRIFVAQRRGSNSDGATTLELVLCCELADGQPDFHFAVGQSYPRLAWLVRYLNEAA